MVLSMTRLKRLKTYSELDPSFSLEKLMRILTHAMDGELVSAVATEERIVVLYWQFNVFGFFAKAHNHWPYRGRRRTDSEKHC